MLRCPLVENLVTTRNGVILNPSRRLAKRATYTAVVEGAGDSDGRAVEDEAGNSMNTDHMWHFKTGRR
jgi:hypothetical protein